MWQVDPMHGNIVKTKAGLKTRDFDSILSEVEQAFDGIQSSSRYPGGMALRFARVKRYRSDKPATEADTIDTVRAIFERGHAG